MSNKYITQSINPSVSQDAGFPVDTSTIISAINYANSVLEMENPIVLDAIDFKAKSGLVSALFCHGLAEATNNKAVVNPIEKGHPDVVPRNALNTRDLMHYPVGIEVKCTAGSCKKGSQLTNNMQRINALNAITWQAHHQTNERILSLIWDFYPTKNSPIKLSPAITGAFYADNLTPADWGAISGTTGYNTKVSGMKASAREKLGLGWIAIIDDKKYILRYKKILKIIS